MKSVLLFFFVVIGWSAYGQDDFQSIDFVAIPADGLTEVPEFDALQFKFTPTSEFFGIKKISDFNRVTTANFRETVDMASVLQQKASLQNNTFDLSRLQNEFNTGNNRTYTSDGATRVQNTVYREQVGLDLLSPCPPTGICSRCAPYRIGRGF